MKKYLGVCFFKYLLFNNAIAAVCPIEEHDSQPVFWDYWGYEPRDCPCSDMKECHKSFCLWHCSSVRKVAK